MLTQISALKKITFSKEKTDFLIKTNVAYSITKCRRIVGNDWCITRASSITVYCSLIVPPSPIPPSSDV